MFLICKNKGVYESKYGVGCGMFFKCKFYIWGNWIKEGDIFCNYDCY